MSTYYGTTRTNYFKVTDETRFRELIGKCNCDDDEEMTVWVRALDDGTVTFAFACYGELTGIPDKDGDSSCDNFIAELQKLLPDGEAVIITDAGHEKLHCVNGGVYVITNLDSRYVSLHDIGLSVARELLHNEKWVETVSY